MLVLLVLFTCSCDSKFAKILGIVPTPSPSHQIVYQSMWKELSLRGHQVTVFTPNPLNNSSLTNLTEIDMSSTFRFFREDYIGDTMDKDRYMLAAMFWYLQKMEKIIEEYFIKAKTMFESSSTDFDLIIVETLQPLVYSLGCKFKVPFIGISSMGLLLQTHDAVGNPTHPIVGPDLLFNVIEFDLYKKISSVVHNLWYRIFYYGYFLPKSDKLAKKYWGEDCPYLGDLERNVSLILVNTNPVLHPVRPNVPNIIEMGQVHISIKKPLPQDLQEYLDKSTKGVVYFSLGTNLRSANLKPNIRKIIIEVFAELPYNVLWKWENDHLPDKPKNVMVRKWFPQQDILRHKHIKAFVTQGGLQSMEEAVNNSVPMVGIPFISDQPLNVMKMVKLGIGRSIDYIRMTKEGLKDAIIDVAENKKYRENIKQISSLLTDQPSTGLEKSIWWIEYILRQKSARNLRCPAADMTWFEYYMIDVFALLLMVLFIFIYFIFYCNRIFLKAADHNAKIKVK